MPRHQQRNLQWELIALLGKRLSLVMTSPRWPRPVHAMRTRRSSSPARRGSSIFVVIYHQSRSQQPQDKGRVMERHEIEAFLTLAEELHFRRATERIGAAPGRVSQIIQKLERKIGAPLFERTSRRVSLTPLGADLRDELLPAHEQVQRAIAKAVAAGRDQRRVLRVGYSSPMAADLVLKAAERFRGSYPESTVQIHEIQLADPLGPIRSGQVHMQLTELPVREPDLTVGPVLFTEERRLMVPRGHRLAAYESVGLEDLADATVITFTGSIPTYWVDYHYPTQTPLGRPIARVEAGYWQEALSMVGAGRGVTFACARAEQYYSRPDTVWIPYRDGPLIEYAVIQPKAGLTSHAETFLRLLQGTDPRRRGDRTTARPA
ncbi:LysR family transcriptional regulator [Streptomyces sp. NPDC000410]|uniref:LysR substrate-binding domain-containing protein n=1 Tax=Streptomyces sp. NPDC000410 TaxID=3154254 RepID=UPI00332750AE